MAQHRTIRQVVPAQTVDMGGIPVDQPLPYSGIDQVDPFLLIHHLSNSHPGGAKPENLGIGPHPHRGFSPVTFIYKGDVHHRDSEGNNAIVEAGGTQWMHSGSGLLHS
ncbi:MAG: pirin family protein, partial [Bacteroidota bacterium]